jgi:hypothetical protein
MDVDDAVGGERFDRSVGAFEQEEPQGQGDQNGEGAGDGEVAETPPEC